MSCTNPKISLLNLRLFSLEEKFVAKTICFVTHASVQVCDRIGFLLPTEEEATKFLQLYFIAYLNAETWTGSNLR